MTTTAYLRLRPKIAEALTKVKLAHCAPPAFKPQVDIVDSDKCPKCGSRLVFKVFAASGLTDGRCVAACGVEWSAQ